MFSHSNSVKHRANVNTQVPRPPVFMVGCIRTVWSVEIASQEPKRLKRGAVSLADRVSSVFVEGLPCLHAVGEFLVVLCTAGLDVRRLSCNPLESP